MDQVFSVLRDLAGVEMGPQEAALAGNLKELKHLVHVAQVDLKNWRDPKTLQTLLHVAAETDQVEVIHYLTSGINAVPIHEQDKEGNTALHTAVKNGCKLAMNALLALGINDTILNNDQDPAFHLAIKQGSNALDLIEDFIGHPNMHLMIEGRQGQNCLHVLALNDDLKVMKLIHSKIVSVGTPSQLYVQDRNGATIVHIAARFGAYRIMDYLLSTHKDCHQTLDNLINTPSNDKRFPMHYAVDNIHREIVEILLKYGASCTVLSGNHSPPIHIACSLGELDMVKLMVDFQGKEILQFRDKDGGTVLHSSTSSISCKDLIPYLIVNGVSVDETDHFGLTPLANGVFLGNTSATMCLLHSKANPYIKDNDGRNVLMFAVLAKRAEVFKAIVSLEFARQLANDPDNQGKFAIHYALSRGISGMMDSLLELTELRVKDLEGNNYVHLAAISGNDKTLMQLLRVPQTQPMINEANLAGYTPLHYAALNCSLPAVQKLIDSGAIIHRTNLGITPFMLACSKGKFRVSSLLFDVNKFQQKWVDHAGNTSLHWAVEGKDPQVITLCLDSGIPITLNYEGMGFFDKIIFFNNHKLAQAAIEHSRWEECIDIVSPDLPHPVFRIIDEMPDIYGVLLDQCFTKCTGDPASKEYWEEFNFKGVTTDIAYKTRIKMKEKQAHELEAVDSTIHLHTGSGVEESNAEIITTQTALRKHAPRRRNNLGGCNWFTRREEESSLAVIYKLIKNKHESYLLHPVVVSFIQTKWSGFGRYYHLFKLFIYFILALFLSFLVSYLPPPSPISMSLNESANATCCEDGLDGRTQALLYLTLLICFPTIIIFFVEATIHGLYFFKQILYEIQAWLSLLAALCSIFFIISILAIGEESAWWNALALGILFAWLSVGFSLQLIKFWNIGVYITIMMSTIRLVMKVLIIMFVFYPALAFPIYVLLGGDERLQFTTIGVTFFAMLHTLIAVTDYLGIIGIEQRDQLRFPTLTFLMLVLIIIILPIVIINILIGLAVGDIARIQKEAIISRREVEVRALSNLERMRFFLKRRPVENHRHYPNQKLSILHWVAKALHMIFKDRTYYADQAGKNAFHKVLLEDRELMQKRLGRLTERVEEIALDNIEQADRMKHLEEMLEKLLLARENETRSSEEVVKKISAQEASSED